jgi:hypothetical protein
MIDETMKHLNNMTKKKIGLCFVHEGISEKIQNEFYTIKFIKKITLSLMSILYIVPYHVHTIKLIIH